MVVESERCWEIGLEDSDEEVITKKLWSDVWGEDKSDCEMEDDAPIKR